MPSSSPLYADKIVAIPGPPWYSGALFQNPESLNAAPGEIGRPRRSTGTARTKVTGNVGGGVWYASSHSRNPEAVETFLEFVTTSERTAERPPAFPHTSCGRAMARSTGRERLLRRRLQAAGPRRPGASGTVGISRASHRRPPRPSVIPGLAAGETLADLSEEWQQEMENQAQVQGYTSSRNHEARTGIISTMTKRSATGPSTGRSQTAGIPYRRPPGRSQTAARTAPPSRSRPTASHHGPRLPEWILGAPAALRCSAPAVYALYLAFTRARSSSSRSTTSLPCVLGTTDSCPPCSMSRLYLVIWLIVQTVFVVFLALHRAFDRDPMAVVEHEGFRLLHPRRSCRCVQRDALVVHARPHGQPGLRPAPGRSAWRPSFRRSRCRTFRSSSRSSRSGPGAGGWIVIMYGALNNISARGDGGRTRRWGRSDQDGVVHPDPHGAEVDLLHGRSSTSRRERSSSSSRASCRKPAREWSRRTTPSTSWRTCTRSGRATSTARRRSR